MSRNRLAVSKRDETRTVQRRRLAVADILARVALPMTATWGIATSLLTESDPAGRAPTATTFTLGVLGGVQPRINNLSEGEA